MKDLHKELLAATIRYRGLNLLFLSQIFISDYSHGIYKHFSLTSALKRVSLENISKFIAFKVSQPFSLKRQKLDFQYLFVNDVNSGPVSGTLVGVRDQFNPGESATLVFDKRLGKVGEKLINAFEYTSFFDLLGVVVDTFILIPRLFRHRSEVHFLSRKYHVNVFLLFLNCIDSIFMVKVVENFFAHISSDKIILMTDVHKLSRIVVLVSKHRARPTFVIQHGELIGAEGYLPISADKMLVWGKQSQEWLIERGESPEKLIPVGAPKMDELKFDRSTPNAAIRKCLIITSTITYEREFLNTIRQAFEIESMRNIELMVKLHPGLKTDYSFIVYDCLSSESLRYTIYKYENMLDMIREADIIIGTTSSAMLEAIILGKPIYQFKGGAFDDIQMNWEPYNCSHTFRTWRELSELISNAESIYSKTENYSKFLNDAFVKLDGRAKERIRDYVTAYLPTSSS